MSSWLFLSFSEVNFDAVFDDLFASLFPIQLRNQFENLVSLNIDWVLENFLKVLRQNLTPFVQPLLLTPCCTENGQNGVEELPTRKIDLSLGTI